MEDQLLAREWHERHGCTLYSAGSRLQHNYLPRNSEMKKLRREKRQAKNGQVTLQSSESAVDSPSSLWHLDLQEGYIDIEVVAGNAEVLSREIPPSLLLGQCPSSLPLTCSQPPTPSTCTSPTPTPTDDSDLMSCSTPGSPQGNSNNSSSSLYSTFPMDECTLCG